MPLYAEYSAIHLTTRQFVHICKGRVPAWVKEHGGGSIRIAQTKDGKWWGEWRGAMVFWANRWFKIPNTVGERAKKIDEFVDSL